MFVMPSVVVLFVEALAVALLLVGALLRSFFLRQPRAPETALRTADTCGRQPPRSQRLVVLDPLGHEMLCPGLARSAVGEGAEHWTADLRWATVAAVWPRIRGGSRNPSSLVVRVTVFLSVLVLWLLILDHETVRSMTRPLDRSGPPTAPVLAVEGASTAGTVTPEEPRMPPTAPSPKAPAPPSLPTAPPAGAPAGSCDDLGVLVDRSHPLPPDYAPRDLVALRTYGVTTLGSGELELRREAAERLRNLVSAAAADGEELVVASAYRSYADQEASHARLKDVYGPDAERMSASPGHSQHQLGTAVAFTNAAAGVPGLGTLRAHERFAVAVGPRPRARVRAGLPRGRGRGDRLRMGALALPLRGGRERREPRGERPEPARVPRASRCGAQLLGGSLADPSHRDVQPTFAARFFASAGLPRTFWASDSVLATRA
jgi:hypothetical protein